MSRVYLDHNATTPLRPEARAAMIHAMDEMGNPSSVHAEGRAARKIVEGARDAVAAMAGCSRGQVIFTASATEAAALAAAQRAHYAHGFWAPPTEHDCLYVWSDDTPRPGGLVATCAANSETGVMRANGCVAGGAEIICDITQMAGKAPVCFEAERPAYMILSAHKLGGPKGVGALINFTPHDPHPLIKGGGQEMGRRAGTENIIGIAGFGAAAAAAQADVAAGIWGEIEKRRDILEKALADISSSTIFVGKGDTRLPNTSCFVTHGWKGETQVMQMDLAGFSISAGSACSSGKVKESRVLRALGYGEASGCGVRVSLGLQTTQDDITRFADAWGRALAKHENRSG